eukprot:s678_g23.t1
MQPLSCPSCQGKWPVLSGGLCGVCRTLDRLSAYCRGPQIPPEGGPGLVNRLRGLLGELQDFSEELRGVVPCPSLAPPSVGESSRREGGSAGAPQPKSAAVGATAKAGAPEPPPTPGSAGVAPKEELKEETREDTKEETLDDHPHRSIEPKRERSRDRSNRDRKRRRKSRSGRRSPRASRSRLASPVRPEGVKRETSPEDHREEIKRRRVQPRSPSHSPPRDRDRGRAGPSERPLGSGWRGPIPAGRREPAPGEGRHFGKNKGKRKKERAQAYWRGAIPQGRERRQPRAREPRGRRRPAHAEEEEAREVEGELFESGKLTLEQCRALKEIEVVDGSYWEAPAQMAFRVQEVQMRGGEPYLMGQVLGTRNEDLLRVASGRPDQRVEAHLCPAGCPGTPHAEGLVHVRTFRHLGLRREGWMSNLQEAVPERGPGDEMRELRREHEAARLEDLTREQRPGRGKSASPRSRDGERGRKRSRSRRKKRPKLKVEARKDLKAVFACTGADPDPAVRKRFRRKAAKVAKKKGKDAKSRSSQSSSGSSSIESEERALFGSTNRVHAIGRRLPGTLLCAALEEASESARDAVPGCSLDCITTAGTPDGGGGIYVHNSRVCGSRKACPRRGPGALRCQPPVWGQDGPDAQDGGREQRLRQERIRQEQDWQGRDKEGRRQERQQEGQGGVFVAPGVDEKSGAEDVKCGATEDGEPLLTRGWLYEGDGMTGPREPHDDLQRSLGDVSCGAFGVEESGVPSTEGPIHDWLGPDVLRPPDAAEVHVAAAERVDGVQHGPGMLAAAAGNSTFGAALNGAADGALHGAIGPGLTGLSFRDLGEPIFQSLQSYLWTRTSKTMSTAQEFLFPLPLGDYDGVHPDMQPYLGFRTFSAASGTTALGQNAPHYGGRSRLGRGKAVAGATLAEVQGAWIDGVGGVAYAKPEKILKYMGLAWELVRIGRATVRELQVVAGGLGGAAGGKGRDFAVSWAGSPGPD